MAGIYFQLETNDDGDIDATLTGYFRLRGEVDVLGLISASHRAVPRAHVRDRDGEGRRPGDASPSRSRCCSSRSRCRDQLREEVRRARTSDPSFVEIMGLSALRRPAPPGRGTSTATRSRRVRRTRWPLSRAVFTALPNGLHESGELLARDDLRVAAPAHRRRRQPRPDRRELPGVRRLARDARAARSSTIARRRASGSFDTEPDPDSPRTRFRDAGSPLFGETEVRDPQVQRPGGARSCPLVPGRGRRRRTCSTSTTRSPRRYPGRLPAGHERAARRTSSTTSATSRSTVAVATTRRLDNEFSTTHELEGEKKKTRQWHYVDRTRFPADAQGNARRSGSFAEAYRFYDRPRRARELSAQDPRRCRRHPSRPRSTSTASSRSAATTRSCCGRSASRSTSS